MKNPVSISLGLSPRHHRLGRLPVRPFPFVLVRAVSDDGLTICRITQTQTPSQKGGVLFLSLMRDWRGNFRTVGQIGVHIAPTDLLPQAEMFCNHGGVFLRL